LKEEELINACYNGKLDDVKKLLSEGADVNYTNDFGSTPLHNAATYGHIEIAELLIKEGAYVDPFNGEKDTPLASLASACVSMKDEKVVTYKALVELLVNSGADINAICRWERTPLHWAIDLGHEDIAELLIAKGAATTIKDQDGDTPLDLAINYGRNKIASLLSEKNGDKQFIEKQVLSYTNLCSEPGMPKGTTPVFIACDRDNKEVLKYLVDRGDKINIQNAEGFSPLHVIARGTGSIACATLLLAKGASLDLLTNTGMTALHWAAATNKHNLVEILLKAGAKKDIKNSDGNTPLDIAMIDSGKSQSSTYQQIIKLLSE
jgi:ankyrin repeat protein